MKYSKLFLICSIFLITNGFASNGFDDNSFESHVMGMEIPKTYDLPEVVVGNQSANKTLIIYFSYSCPHCRDFFLNVYPTFKAKYVDTGNVQIIFRNYISDQATCDAAQLIRFFCTDPVQKVVDAEKFIKLSLVILEREQEWKSSNNPKEYLKELFCNNGFSKQDIEKALESMDIMAGLMLGQQTAIGQYGIVSTPTFIYEGKCNQETVTKEKRHMGAVTIENLEMLLEDDVDKNGIPAGISNPQTTASAS